MSFFLGHIYPLSNVNTRRCRGEGRDETDSSCSRASHYALISHKVESHVQPIVLDNQCDDESCERLSIVYHGNEFGLRVNEFILELPQSVHVPLNKWVQKIKYEHKPFI